MTDGASPSAPISGVAWFRLLVGVALVYALFHWSATALGSDRGQAGLAVGTLVVAALLVVERVLFGEPPSRAARKLGLLHARSRGLLAAGASCALLLLVFPVFSLIDRNSLGLYPRWHLLLPGLFAQAGIAEEVLFRGFLFGCVREGRSFWRAVGLASLPFVAVHLVLFFTMPWPIALAALLLSALLSAPLAYLFELCGGSVWAPALVHFTIQGAIKVITLEREDASFAIVWMAASAALPWLVFLVPRGQPERPARAVVAPAVG